MLVVDGANVVGSVPDGWWRDRAGAAARLLGRLVATDLGEVVLVLEGAARAGAPAGRHGAVRVVHAPGSGDAAIIELAGPGVTVVTADRALAAQVRSAGGQVTGPSWLLGRLPPSAGVAQRGP